MVAHSETANRVGVIAGTQVIIIVDPFGILYEKTKQKLLQNFECGNSPVLRSTVFQCESLDVTLQVRFQ